MKKFLIVTILFVFPLIGFAQISRNFWGVTLGKSNKTQVRTALVNRGYRVQTEPDGSLSVNVNNVNFGGAMWTYVSFSFVNGYLSQVWFQNNEHQSPIPVDNVYEKVKMSLDKKYRHYYYNLPKEDGITWSNYSDSKTHILLGVRTYHYTRYVSLCYKDVYLEEKKEQMENDEL